ncbi:MAG: hypothetical protein HY829_00335 [Actinobacteria bacterium]|nr:hypothetical protein [Actinomycetota bacterium]
MSNAAGAKARREEEIAFLVMEQILGVDIRLADAGAGNKRPDGAWLYPGEQERRGIVEVTSPPDSRLMSAWARAKRRGEPQSEEGSVPSRLNELAEVCTELLAEDWAQENLAKLVAETADERHLFLLARSHRVGHYFYRLSDSYDNGTTERLDDIVLPAGLTDIWFRGRARRYECWGTTDLWVARFQTGSGWHRYVVQIEETALPSPNPDIADDLFPSRLRRPKDRSGRE